MLNPTKQVAVLFLPATLIVVASLACNPLASIAPSASTTPTPTATPTATPTETPLPTHTPTPAPVIYIQDDFSKPGDSTWYLEFIEDPSLEEAEITDGRYRLFSKNLEFPTQVTYYQRQADFAASVDIQFPAGAGRGSAGLIFRHGSNYEGYRVAISGNGFYFLDKYDGQELTYLIDWRGSSAIRREPGAVNQVAVLAEGAHLTLVINGQVVDEFDDSEFTEGDFALALTNFDPAGTEVLFDNFLVTDVATWYAQPPALP